MVVVEQLTNITSEMAAPLAIISDDFFGEHYFDHHILPLYEQQESPIFLVARANDAVIAFAFGWTAPRNRLSEWVNIPLPNELKLSEQVAILNTVAVSQAFQHQHIATHLVKQLLDKFHAAGAHSCFAIGWKQGETIFADRLNRAVGFHVLGEQPNYWLQETLNQQYRCSVCGEICHCSAVIYFLEKV